TCRRGIRSGSDSVASGLFTLSPTLPRQGGGGLSGRRTASAKLRDRAYRGRRGADGDRRRRGRGRSSPGGASARRWPRVYGRAGLDRRGGRGGIVRGSAVPDNRSLFG